MSEELLERESEVAAVARLLDAVAGGAGGCLLVEGPAGIGKTALLQVARELAEGRSMRVLSAHGAELEQDLPYGVVRQLFEATLAELDEAERDGLLEGAAGLAAAALELPLRRRPLPTLDPSSTALHGLYWLTANLAAGGSVALVVDDAHWADVASLRFLAYLAGRLQGVPVALIAAVRAGEPGEWVAPLAELRALGSAEVLYLAGLSHAAVGLLMAREGGSVPEAALVAAAHEATGGNPFLTSELTAALVADGIPLTREAAARVGTLGPRTVWRSIMVRVAGLAPAASPVLRAVAVLGDRAELRYVAALASVAQPAAASAAGELVRCGLLRDGLPLGFAHPILRSAVYEDMSAPERADWHGRASGLLSHEGADRTVVAGHLLLAEPAGQEQVVVTLRAAAGAALAGGAPEAAVAYLRRALAEPVPDQDRPGVLHELAAAETLLRDPAAVAHLREAHALARDPARRATYAYDLANLLGYAGHWSEGVELLLAAIDELGDRDQALRLRLTALRVATTHDPRYVADLDHELPQLLELAQGSSAPEARALRVHLALTLASRGAQTDLVQALVAAGLDDGALIAEEGSDSLAAAQAVHALVYADELDAAREVAEALLASARTSGSVLGFAAGTGTRALVNVRAGSLAEVEADARTAVELAQQHGLFLIAPFVAAYLVQALIERGAVAEAAELVAAVGLPDQFARMPQAATLAEAAARVAHAQGKFAESAAAWRRSGEIFEDCGVHSPNIASWRSELALLLAPDDREAARDLVEDELDRARRASSIRATGIALRARGLIAGGEPGLEDLAASARELERSGAVLEHARTLTELGAALRRANQRADAREPLRHARELAHRCGAFALTERAETELRATGARPRRLAVTGIDALTASERRVAQLAADGLSNSAIAQQLFVTVNTVESHLRRIYLKLDIHSRRELSDRLSAS